MRDSGVLLIACVLVVYAASVVAAWRRPTDPRRLELRQGHFRIDVNDADVDTLCLLPGIGPNLAERVVARRREHGPFAEEGQLTEVPGIGLATQARLAPFVRVGVPGGFARGAAQPD